MLRALWAKGVGVGRTNGDFECVVLATAQGVGERHRLDTVESLYCQLFTGFCCERTALLWPGLFSSECITNVEASRLQSTCPLSGCSSFRG